MQKLTKPPRLRRGDKIAAVSLSWGGAGDPELRHRYEVGKKRLHECFGLELVEMPHTLAGSDFVYAHPELRARDLMDAFADPEIKGVFACIGGDDSIRMLPYIDYAVVRDNPKVLLGYSDTTISHLICHKAGLSSFYGPSILAEFAENIRMFDYTAQWVERVLFCAEPPGELVPSEGWTGEYVEWAPENIHVEKQLQPNTGHVLLQGSGVVEGHLFGGCIEVLDFARGTSLWPEAGALDGAVLFFETSEETPPPGQLTYMLRSLCAMGVISRAAALLFGKPYQGRYYEEYKAVITRVMAEYQLQNTPVLYNMSFGHNQPMLVLPYGAVARVNCDERLVTLLEPAVC